MAYGERKNLSAAVIVAEAFERESPAAMRRMHIPNETLFTDTVSTIQGDAIDCGI